MSNNWRIVEKRGRKADEAETVRGRIEPGGIVDTFATKEAANKFMDDHQLHRQYEVEPIPDDGSVDVRKA